MSTERKSEVGPGGAVPQGAAGRVVTGRDGSKKVILPRDQRVKPLRLRVHGWLRWLHIYISMFSLLAILFFSLTGITLNHPDWAINSTETKKELKGQFPKDWKKGAQVDWWRVVDYLRQTNGVRGTPEIPQADSSQDSLTFKGPGYTADCFVNLETGSYELTVSALGLVGVMNDFHRGSETGNAWRWVIDFSGVFLSVVALTGLGLLYYLKKIRVAAFMAMGVGIAIVLVLMKLAS